MPKKKQPPPPPPPSSRATLAVLAVGGLLVAGLVVWALTRTVETHAPVAATETSAPIAAPITSATTTASSTPQLPVSVAPPPSEESKASVPRIAVEDLREKMKAGQVTVVDVRPAESYQAAHIEGAINIPMASIESELSLLPKNKQIITYCT